MRFLKSNLSIACYSIAVEPYECMELWMRSENSFRAYAKEMKHVYVKDYIMSGAPHDGRDGRSVTKGGKWLKETIIGQGCMDQVACLAELDRVGYRGMFAFENNHGEDFLLGTAIGMQRLNKHHRADRS